MIVRAAILAQGADRTEGWLWWFALVGGVLTVFLLLAVIRRRLIRPMPHTPTDTTDAWSEAGRRMPVPPKGDGDRPAENPPES